MSTKLKSFHYCFQITKSIIFNVDYYLLAGNKEKYFTTSAAQFNRPKTDFNHCGQAQKSLLPRYKSAYSFYKKWDSLHLLDLTAKQHTEILEDLQNLCNSYNYMVTNYDKGFGFSTERELSKRKLKSK